MYRTYNFFCTSQCTSELTGRVNEATGKGFISTTDMAIVDVVMATVTGDTKALYLIRIADGQIAFRYRSLFSEVS